MQRLVDGVLVDMTADEIAEFNARPITPPPIPTITRLQFLLQAATASYITQDEALAAATTGAVPALITAVINALPSGQQFAAKVKWAAMTIVERNDPLAGAIAMALSLTSAQVDAFFISAGGL